MANTLTWVTSTAVGLMKPRGEKTISAILGWSSENFLSFFSFEMQQKIVYSWEGFPVTNVTFRAVISIYFPASLSSVCETS